MEQIHKSRNKCAHFTGELRATKRISIGESISIQYVNILEGTIPRREALLENWNFLCVCPRCEDPTEFGSYFSAVKCSVCPTGYLLPILHPEEIFICQNCGTLKSKQEIDSLISPISDQIAKTFKMYVKFIEKLIRKFEKILELCCGAVLHENHYVLNAIRYKIVSVSTKNNMQGSLCHMNLANENFTKTLLGYNNKLIYIANLIYPGLNTYHAFLSYYYILQLKCFYSTEEIREYVKRSYFRNLIIDGITTLRLEPDGIHAKMAHELTQFSDMYLDTRLLRKNKLE